MQLRVFASENFTFNGFSIDLILCNKHCASLITLLCVCGMLCCKDDVSFSRIQSVYMRLQKVHSY